MAVPPGRQLVHYLTRLVHQRQKAELLHLVDHGRESHGTVVIEHQLSEH